MGNKNYTLRAHLRTHGAEWLDAVKALSLKLSEPTASTATPNSPNSSLPLPLQPEELLTLLVEWVVADDQVCPPSYNSSLGHQPLSEPVLSSVNSSSGSS